MVATLQGHFRHVLCCGKENFLEGLLSFCVLSRRSAVIAVVTRTNTCYIAHTVTLKTTVFRADSAFLGFALRPGEIFVKVRKPRSGPMHRAGYLDLSCPETFD